MEAIVAVLRPKPHGTVSQDFNPRAYDVLLMDVPIPNSGKNKVMKKLPKTIISYEEEPADAIFTFLYNVTGSQMGGIKAKRAVFVPPSRSEPLSEQDSFSKQGTLYCVPVDSKETLSFKNLPHTPGFFSFDLVLESLETDMFPFSRQSRVMLYRLQSWLKEKHSLPGVIGLLFSVCTEDRLKRSITNPAFFSDTQTSMHTDTMGEDYSRTIANEALAKMMAIEKCDITIINPLDKSDQSFVYKPRVDDSTVNIYWGYGKPDYSKIERIPQEVSTARTIESQNWVDEYPLHKCAFENDADGINELIKQGHTVAKLDRDSWAPIHYAAWFGHLKAISMLLNQGECSPNITNDNGSTPLHLAASKGKVYVIELLLNHPDIDVYALDKYNKTGLDLCESIDKPEWIAATKLLRSAMSKPTPTIQVFLMDGTYRTLNLVSGANTTVQQLHTQMMRQLDIPEGCSHFFTIWICSKNLQLQLKPDHKPIQHLNDWKRKIVGLLTDQDPSREDPQLFWRRDAILSILEERKVKHQVAVNLLFHEAYHNYIKSLYPCANGDAIILGGIIMQINHGDFDQRKTRNFFANERNLFTLVPMSKAQNRSVNWDSKIQAQYKHYSQTMANRDRSTQVLQHHFLTICWNLTVYGSAFFTGYVQVKTSRSPTTVYIGVNDIGVHIINAQTKAMMQSFSYKDIEWGQKNDQRVLEIKLKGTSKGGMCILTKQATHAAYLMTRLNEIHTPEYTLPDLPPWQREHKAGLVNHLMSKLAQLGTTGS